MSGSTVRHSMVPYRPSPALKAKLAGSWPWPVRARTQPFWLMTTVTGSSITLTSATARFSAWIRVRRSSPYCLASASISLTTVRRKVAGLERMSSSLPCSVRSSASSCSILMPSRRANWRRRISRMSSAWRSLSLKRSISAGLGSSLWRMTWMTSSMLSRTFWRPSRMWMRSSTLPRRCWVRRVTVSRRKPTHSVRIWRRPFWVGLPSAPTTVRLMDTELSRLVWASKVVISSC